MSPHRKIITFVAPAALLLAAGCATPFRADVTRFQVMPPPQGQSFTVQASDPRLQGGIEFGMYAGLITQRLAAQGFRPSPPGQPAQFVVLVDYGIDNGHEKVTTEPGFGPYGFGGGWGPGWGGYGGWGYGGFGGGFGYGGFGYGGFGYGGFGGWGYPDVESFTYYVSHLDMRIRSSADGRVLFEGRARARSTDHSLQRIVPNLVQAMFTGFPGRSGEDVLITIPPPPKPGHAPAPPPPPRPIDGSPPPITGT